MIFTPGDDGVYYGAQAAELTVRVSVANEVAVFSMKGICLGQRTKAKDH
jgi:hypothetical protein